MSKKDKSSKVKSSKKNKSKTSGLSGLETIANSVEFRAPHHRELTQVMGENGAIVAAKIATDSGVTVDSSMMPINQMGMNDASLEGVITTFIGWGLLSLLAENGIVQNVIQSVSTDSTSKWGKLHYTGEKDIGDKLKKLEARMADLDTRSKFREAAEKVMLFGGCMLYPKLKGDDLERSKPLPIAADKIKLNSLLYLNVIEPIYCAPYNYNASDPFAKSFYAPQAWNIMGGSIHSERLLKFVANDTPLLLKPIYMFFGISPIQLIFKKIVGFEQTYNEIIKIIAQYNVNILKTGGDALAQVLGGSATSSDVNSIQTRVALFNKIRTNFGTLLLSKQEEEWEQFNMSLTTLDKLLNQSLEIIAAYARIPATKLFGTPPQGFNSTGEHDMDNYYDLITAFQENYLLPNLNRLINMVQLDVFGEIDSDIKFVFNPLKEPTKKEIAEINQLKAQTLTTLSGGQAIITVEEGRKTLAEDEESGFDGLDTDLDITGLGEESDNDNDDPEDTGTET